MATITITIADDKVVNVANDLEYLFDHPAGVSNINYIQDVLKAQLRILRKTGRQKKTVANIDISDSDIL